MVESWKSLPATKIIDSGFGMLQVYYRHSQPLPYSALSGIILQLLVVLGLNGCVCGCSRYCQPQQVELNL